MEKQNQLTVDVTDFIQFQQGGAFLVQLFTRSVCRRTVVFLWPIKSHLSERPLQHFHEAVRVGVIVNGWSVALTPTEHHQIEFAIAFVNQISCVPKDTHKMRTLRIMYWPIGPANTCCLNATLLCGVEPPVDNQATRTKLLDKQGTWCITLADKNFASVLTTWISDAESI